MKRNFVISSPLPNPKHDLLLSIQCWHSIQWPFTHITPPGSVPTSEQASSDRVPQLWPQKGATGCSGHVLVVMMQLIGDTVQIIKTESLQLIREQLAQSAPHLHTVLVNHSNTLKKKEP